MNVNVIKSINFENTSVVKVLWWLIKFDCIYL